MWTNECWVDIGQSDGSDFGKRCRLITGDRFLDSKVVPDQGAFQKLLQALQFKSSSIFNFWMKYMPFNVWVKYFEWNFNGYLWNSTKNILLIHWEICCFLHNIVILRALRCKSSHIFFKHRAPREWICWVHLSSNLEMPWDFVNPMCCISNCNLLYQTLRYPDIHHRDSLGQGMNVWYQLQIQE